MSPKTHEELFSSWQHYCGGVEMRGETELEEVDYREASLGVYYPWTTLVWLCFPTLHEVNTRPPSFIATTMIFLSMHREPNNYIKTFETVNKNKSFFHLVVGKNQVSYY